MAELNLNQLLELIRLFAYGRWQSSAFTQSLRMYLKLLLQRNAEHEVRLRAEGGHRLADYRVKHVRSESRECISRCCDRTNKAAAAQDLAVVTAETAWRATFRCRSGQRAMKT